MTAHRTSLATGIRAGLLVLAVLAGLVSMPTAGQASADAAVQPFVGVTPVRVASTVSGSGVAAGAVPAGGVLEVPVAGRAGVPADASAAAVTVSSLGSSAAGVLRVFPCGVPVPGVAVLHHGAGQPVAGSAVVKLGAGGKVCVHARSATDVLVDLTGYFPAGSAPTDDRQLASSESFSCLLTAGGAVQCWGANYVGQLGDGSTTPRPAPVVVAGVAGASAIDVGAAAACAIVAGGAIKCWGGNIAGQLGDGTTTDRSTAVPVAGVTGATAIDVFDWGACAIAAGGAVQCWGSGFGPTPKLVAGVTGAVDIDSLCALVAGGVACWQDDGEMPVAAPVAGVAGATSITGNCAVVAGGAVWCWDRDLVAGLVPELSGMTSAAFSGYGNCAVVAGDVKCWQEGGTPTTVNGVSGATSVSASGHSQGVYWVDFEVYPHACAVVAGGAVQCWGYNGYGQLGAADRREYTSPVTVPGVSGAASVITARDHTCALLAAGGLQCWGSNTSGQLGGGRSSDGSTPVAVVGLGKAAAASTSQAHSCALVAGGAVQCWGLDAGSGALGTGSRTDWMAPVAVVGLTGASAISSAGKFYSPDDFETSSGFTCAVVGTGAKCWGRNTSGQLGDGTRTDRARPVAVAGLSGVRALDAGAGLDDRAMNGLGASPFGHTCALLATGAARCWGDNAYGQIGDGTTRQRLAPTAVSGLTGAKAITAGDSHSCALVPSGKVKCWGDNAAGQLGDGTKTRRLLPVPVAGLTGATRIVAGQARTCAVLANGSVQCWGAGFGSVPKPVAGVTGAAAISDVCAVVAGGAVQCWGAGAAASAVPDIAGATSVVSDGADRSCAVLAAGDIRCWGDNRFGQLGAGFGPVAVALQ